MYAHLASLVVLNLLTYFILSMYWPLCSNPALERRWHCGPLQQTRELVDIRWMTTASITIWHLSMLFTTKVRAFSFWRNSRDLIRTVFILDPKCRSGEIEWNLNVWVVDDFQVNLSEMKWMWRIGLFEQQHETAISLPAVMKMNQDSELILLCRGTQSEVFVWAQTGGGRHANEAREMEAARQQKWTSTWTWQPSLLPLGRHPFPPVGLLLCLRSFYGLQPSEVQPEATGWIGSTAALARVPRLMLSLSLFLSDWLSFLPLSQLDICAPYLTGSLIYEILWALRCADSA